MRTLPPSPEMQRAFACGDAAYDGVFFTGVRTTGIFCRPSCRAKKPKPRHVEFFPGVREAMFAGYRACRRCRPLEAAGRPPTWVARLLAEAERAGDRRVTDADVRRAGAEPARARRWFMAHYGMTYHAYCRGLRLGAALQRIRRGADLDEVIMESGYESHSGFRDAFTRTFGLPPGKGRELGCIRLAWIPSPLGPLVAGATDKGVCLLEFTDPRMLETQLGILRRRFQAALVPGRNPHLERLEPELAAYFAGTQRRFSVPLDAPGSPFEERVWAELLRIPYGQTASYEALARRLGEPRAVRAVGTANGRNRVAIVIPCHRVVNKDGRLGGYGGGLWRKERLLELERGEAELALEGAAAAQVTA